MQFEWDEAKDRLNQSRHGIEFELASHVFDDPRCDIYQDRIDEATGEMRWHATGAVKGRRGAGLLLVVHVYREGTENEEIIRIISARKADKSERRRYQEASAH